MRRAGLPVAPIAQQKQRRTTLRCAHAEPPAGGEIERFGHAPDISNDAGHRLAGKGFLRHPKQIAHVERPHDHQLIGIEAKEREARPIGQAEKLGIGLKLQVEHGHAPLVEQGLGLPQRKAQARAPVADGIGEHFLQETAGQLRKRTLRHGKGACLPLG